MLIPRNIAEQLETHHYFGVRLSKRQNAAKRKPMEDGKTLRKCQFQGAFEPNLVRSLNLLAFASYLCFNRSQTSRI